MLYCTTMNLKTSLVSYSMRLCSSKLIWWHISVYMNMGVNNSTQINTSLNRQLFVWESYSTPEYSTNLVRFLNRSGGCRGLEASRKKIFLPFALANISLTHWTSHILVWKEHHTPPAQTRPLQPLPLLHSFPAGSNLHLFCAHAKTSVQCPAGAVSRQAQPNANTRRDVLLEPIPSCHVITWIQTNSLLNYFLTLYICHVQKCGI